MHVRRHDGSVFQQQVVKENEMLLRFWPQESKARMNSAAQGLLKYVDHYRLQQLQFNRNLYFTAHSLEYSDDNQIQDILSLNRQH